jgi:DNA-binding NtrC family response regulator
MIPVVILDLQLKDENGIEVLKQILALKAETEVIMLTGYGTIETAVEAIKLGAFDFIQKPAQIGKLVQLVQHAIQINALPKAGSDVVSASAGSLSTIITQNADMLELLERASQVAPSDLPVLICGESGTGKELLANFIHIHSARAQSPYQKINCAAFPEQLLDNELFGHERGAFTGADSEFEGLFERSNEGSLFLDEVGDMPLALQAKILRVIQNQEIRRLGGKKTITVNVRFIAATNKDLHSLMHAKQFRQDLYYRLSPATFYIPALRERRDDILLLADHFLQQFASGSDNIVKKLCENVTSVLVTYDWPGNIRELKNTLHYAATVCPQDRIGVEHLPPNFFQKRDVGIQRGVREDVEKSLILKTLKEVYYNKSKAAEILNMSRSTLYAKMQKYGIAIQKK